MQITAVYPGTFDPFTNGHIDLVRRAIRIFPRLIVAVASNPQKNPLFTLEERLAIIREGTADLTGLEIDTFDMLTVEYVRKKGAQVILRGLRAASDFEYEFQMATMNRRLDERIETVFVMAREDYTFVSSRFIREIASMGGDVSELVPPPVIPYLNKA